MESIHAEIILRNFIFCSSVHRNSRLKKSNKVQQYADIHLLLYMFRASIAPIIRST